VKRKVAYRSGYLVNRGGEIYVKYEDVIYDADLFREIYVKKIYLSRVCVIENIYQKNYLKGHKITRLSRQV